MEASKSYPNMSVIAPRKSVIIGKRRMQAVAEGKVTWFNEKKGFGYIEMDGGGDVFVDEPAIQKTGLKTLTFGQLVNFDLVQEPKGSVAKNVDVL